MSAPTAVIAEDEPVLRAQLREALATLWPELDIRAEVADGVAALRALADHAPDVLFLDIQMPGLTGIEVARHTRGQCHVVFVTGYDEHAVAAFEQGAVDYVMKPFAVDRLAVAVERVKKRMRSVPADIEGILRQFATGRTPGREYLRWITASQGNDLRFITVEEILYFQAANKYTIVMTAQGESLIRRPIKDLSEEVDPAMFWQVHRSTLVNVNAIAGGTRDLRGRLRLKLKNRKETLPVSEPYEHLFRHM
jgi:DNA-binding LytR/AlgR family response regulator